MSKKRRSPSAAWLSGLAMFVLFIYLGYYVLTGSDPLGVVGAAETAVPGVEVPRMAPAGGPSPATTPARPGATWWEVYFTDPTNIGNPQDFRGSIEGRLIEKINAAQTSIHIASFEFDLTPVADALIAAHNRGVEVRWVTDDEHGLLADEEPGHGQFAALKAAGVEVKDDLGRSALMHNKFWIFDRKIVWTGSTNITENGVFEQNNNTIVIQSPALAEIYESEFEEMWDGKFGPTSPSQLPEQSTSVDGTAIQVIFTSEDGALEQAIIPAVLTAQSRIRFLAFSFTDFPLADAMIQRARNGVDVAGVFEKVGSETESAELKTLYCANVPVRQDGNPSFLHDKIVLIDERLVITGSLNFSTNAEESNDENVIVVENPEIARLYMQEFERIWAQGTNPGPGDVTCP